MMPSPSEILLLQPRHIYAPAPDVDPIGHIYMPTSLLTAGSRLVAADARVTILDENLTTCEIMPEVVGINLLGAPYVDAAIKKYRAALKQLRNAGLIQSADPTEPLDCHPLVREHFAAVMRAEAPEAFRDGHFRLYKYYAEHSSYRAETIEEMTPVFNAVYTRRAKLENTLRLLGFTFIGLCEEASCFWPGGLARLSRILLCWQTFWTPVGRGPEVNCRRQQSPR